jgi:hypothetical protein
MKTYLHIGIVALLLAACFAPAAPAPDDGGDDAVRKAADACFNAISERNWKALAAQLHPESLEEFKAAVAPALRRAATPRVGKKGIPDFQDGIVLGMLDEADPKKLLAMPPREFFAAFVEATLPEGDKRLFGGMEARVVGKVREGRDLVHVVYRAKGKVRFAEGMDDRGNDGTKKLELVGEVTRMGVLTLKRSGGSWKAVVPDELLYVTAFLKGEWKEK